MTWNRKQRDAYYLDVKKKRGEASMQQLIGEVNRQWQMARNQQEQAALF